jgi:hypothetical protein
LKNDRRYNLDLPEKLDSEIRGIAKEEGVALITILRRFLTLGVFLFEQQKKKKRIFLEKDDGKMIEIIFF